MQDQLITKETAILAKEKGFKEKVNNWYRSYDDKNIYGLGHKRGGLVPPISCGCGLFPACTQSLLQKWLREKHEIFLYISLYTKYGLVIEVGYKIEIITEFKSHAILRYNSEITSKIYNTYEEALEIGLKEGLQLI